MTKRRWIILIAALVLVLGGGAGITWWQLKPDTPETEPATAQPVGVAIPGAPAEVKIGVLITLSSNPGEGSEWKYAAEGAQVAAERLGMGGVKVQLQTVDDKGSPGGARRAVEELAELGVSGIVAASQGSHLRGAVEAAQDAELPLLLPYEPESDLLGTLVWATGPQEETIGATLQDSIKADERKRPLLIDLGGGTPEGLEVAAKLSHEPDDDLKKLIKEVTAKTKGKKKIDSVLISGPAEQQAVVVQALQGADVTVPVYLTPDATSPAFTTALVKAGGSLSTSLASVGTNSGDPASLATDESGQAMSAFLAATRLMAGDDSKTTLLGDQPFSSVVESADSRSHDAVIALAHAAAARAAGDGVDPMGAVVGLQLDHGDGLAGPALDFSSTAALSPEDVVGLRSADQDLGLRPRAEEAAPRLIWFAAPESK